MKYMALIYTDESNPLAHPEMGTEAGQAQMQAYFDFGAAGAEAGVVLDGDALHPVATATSVRLRDGQVLTTDGPFAETKEQLGGFYVLDGDNLDDAIAWAARIPAAAHGTVEVRPIMDFSDYQG